MYLNPYLVQIMPEITNYFSKHEFSLLVPQMTQVNNTKVQFVEKTTVRNLYHGQTEFVSIKMFM